MKKDYPNIQGIHCFSTVPYFEGRGLSGNECQPEDEFQMPDYLLKTFILSALQWRRLNGPIILFTDKTFYNYLQTQKLLGYWDEVRPVLDDFRREYPTLKQSVFWAGCKLYCYSLMKAPFACIDMDLVVLKPFTEPRDEDLIVAHYEDIDESSYGTEKEMNMKSDYCFCGPKETTGLNMCVCYFRNEKFKNRFVEEAFKIMENSLASYNGRYAMPELLYMEQVKPLQIAHEENYRIGCLMDCRWSPSKGCFVENDERYGYWIFFKLTGQKAPIMHLWFHKNWLAQCPEERKSYTDDLIRFTEKNYPT